MQPEFAVSDRAIQSWHRGEFESAARVRAWRSAVEHLDRLVRETPGSWAPYWHRANLHERLGQWPEADADYSMVISLNPDHAEAYLNRGTVRIDHLNRRGAGEADVSRAKQLLSEPIPSEQPSQNQGSQNEPIH